MLLVINGLTAAGYRIDDMHEERVGFDMLNNPFAIVPKLESAREIVRVMNAQANGKAGKGQA